MYKIASAELTLLCDTTHVCFEKEKKIAQLRFITDFWGKIWLNCEKTMATALSSAYVLLGKATMSDPPEWSTGVGAIHTLSSLLTCAGCHTTIRDTPHGTPDDSFSLYCDKCQESSITSKYKTDVFSRLFYLRSWSCHDFFSKIELILMLCLYRRNEPRSIKAVDGKYQEFNFICVESIYSS